MTLTLDETTSDISPACSADALCSFIADRTGLSWLAETGYYVIVKPLRIVLIIVVAMLLRAAIHRLVRRAVRRATERPQRAQPVPARARPAVRPDDTGGLRLERRRQRAEALGTALRAFASTTIGIVVVLMVLSELGVNVVPLLASAGILSLPLGLAAQHTIRDFFSGLFMLFEDQYGIGDTVRLDDVTGTVEEVGLRITTVRDAEGMLWYVRNGEITRAGNRSQGWAAVFVDVPVAFADLPRATSVLRQAAEGLREDPAYARELTGAIEPLEVTQLTADGALVRVTVKTFAAARERVGRDLRQRLAEALTPAAAAVSTMTDGPAAPSPRQSLPDDEETSEPA